MSRLRIRYESEIAPALMQEFQLQSIMEVPRITKVTLNMGLGEANTNKAVLDKACEELANITGQKPIVTNARKSIAAFKVREGWPIGCKVTLRRDKMYEFLDRLISVAIPRIRDFRGFSAKAFDGRGNYSFGIKEQMVFPEIDFDRVDATRGIDITLTTSSNSDEMARSLLMKLNFPLIVAK